MQDIELTVENVLRDRDLLNTVYRLNKRDL